MHQERGLATFCHAETKNHFHNVIAAEYQYRRRILSIDSAESKIAYRLIRNQHKGKSIGVDTHRDGSTPPVRINPERRSALTRRSQLNSYRGMTLNNSQFTSSQPGMSDMARCFLKVGRQKGSSRNRISF